MNLNQITLPVNDIPAACAFYRALGCVQIVDTPHYARFESPQGNATFSLHFDEGGNRGQTTIYFEVSDVDKAVVRLQDAGIEFEEPPEDKRWLWREALTRDPSGNAVKIYFAGENRKHPPWRVDNSASS